MNSLENFDEQFARKLQEEYDREVAAQIENESNHVQDSKKSGKENKKGSYACSTTSGISPIDPSLEYVDPNPDIRALFIQFNDQFFWGRLSGIEVKWSPRMTLCAGLCVYEGRGGLCSVRLSLPLLKLRPRKDLVETLLHEMIHAYLFITDNNRDHDGHGPQFQKHMHRINKETGASISIYHTFHDEVESYQQHWWRCDGPCQNRRPFFGYVKRAMNRAPSSKDFWWAGHQASCGGTFMKIKEPEGYGQKKGTKKDQNAKCKDIRSFSSQGHVLGSTSKSSSTQKDNVGSSKNPASNFNLKNSTKSSKSSTSSSGNSQSSLVVNGILSKGRENKSSPLFSNVGNSTVSSKTESNSNSSSDKNCLSNVFGKTSSQSQECDRRAEWDDDDDDLWILDIQDDGTLLASQIKDEDSKDTKKPFQSNNIDKKKSKENPKVDYSASQNVKKKPWSGFHGGFKDNNDKKKSKKKSVCEGAFFVMERKKEKKKYIMDELDSNDRLWDIPCSDSVSQSSVHCDVSPLKTKLSGCRVNEKGDEKISANDMCNPGKAVEDSFSKNNISQYVKSEKELSSVRSNSNATFPGHGFRLGGITKGSTSSSQSKISTWTSNIFDRSERLKQDKKIKEEQTNYLPGSDVGQGTGTSGQKRSIEEVFDSDMKDESENEDTSLFSSKKHKYDCGAVSSSESGIVALKNEQVNKSEVFHANNNKESVVQKKVTCPACNARVPETDINIHLDMCLQ